VPTIAIVFHRTADAARMRRYRLWHCAEIWTRAGFDVRLVSGPHVPPGMDLVIPHVDLSVLPGAYRAILDAPGHVLNRRITDIRRRAFSQNLVTPDDGYEGPVIVKTNNNCGSHPERAVLHGQPLFVRLAAVLRSGIGSAARMVAARSTHAFAYATALPTRAYAVLPSKRHVPRGTFQNPHLVVERFLPETDGRHFFLRSYTFLGNEGVAVRSRSLDPVVVGRSGADLEFVPVDERVEEARRAMGFEFGKIDYLMHDGEAVIIDLNTTPTFGAVYTPGAKARICAQLATGIAAWFPGLHDFPWPASVQPDQWR
jgi:hypothetical protein